MNTTVISGRLVRNPGYNEVENEKGLHKIAKLLPHRHPGIQQAGAVGEVVGRGHKIVPHGH